MLCFSGIWYRLISTGAFFLLCGIFILAYSKREQKPNIQRKKLLAGIFTTCFAVVHIAYHAFLLICPSVSETTGVFIDSRRDGRASPPLPFTWAYVFDTDASLNQRYYIDSFSKQQIFPHSGLTPNCAYQIWYESHSRIILDIVELTAK